MSSRKGRRIGYALPVIVDLARLAVGLKGRVRMCPRHFITSALLVTPSRISKIESRFRTYGKARFASTWLVSPGGFGTWESTSVRRNLQLRRKQTLEVGTIFLQMRTRNQPKKNAEQLANYADVGLTVPHTHRGLSTGMGLRVPEKRAAQTALRTVMSRTVFALAAE